MKEEIVCSLCGSKEVNRTAWVNINTKEFKDYLEDDILHCTNCNEYDIVVITESEYNKVDKK